jgi:hypothetical protein
MRDTMLPAMAAVREVADRLEGLVPDDLWPLPKYAEILFIKERLRETTRFRRPRARGAFFLAGRMLDSGAVCP